MLDSKAPMEKAQTIYIGDFKPAFSIGKGTKDDVELFWRGKASIGEKLAYQDFAFAAKSISEGKPYPG